MSSATSKGGFFVSVIRFRKSLLIHLQKVSHQANWKKPDVCSPPHMVDEIDITFASLQICKAMLHSSMQFSVAKLITKRRKPERGRGYSLLFADCFLHLSLCKVLLSCSKASGVTMTAPLKHTFANTNKSHLQQGGQWERWWQVGIGSDTSGLPGNIQISESGKAALPTQWTDSHTGAKRPNHVYDKTPHWRASHISLSDASASKSWWCRKWRVSSAGRYRKKEHIRELRTNIYH